jgi:signal transduction histidine kinase
MEGSFQIKSRPGEGTRIRIEIPLPEAHGISH